ncbi:MAG: ANTAR domain-containing protein [Betaproteobacteria bacterium]
MKNANATPRALRELRSLRVTVFHPDDQDGQELIGQLQRIGCQVKAFWPPLEKLLDEADLVFLAVRPEALSVDLPWLRRETPPPVIAVVTYENPVIVEAVLRLNAYGVIASPVKSFGLLTSIVVAVNQADNAKERDKYVVRLEQRLAAQRKIAKAKVILMQSRSISEDEAYNMIRNQAMSRRVTTEEIADAVIKANELLGFEAKR